MNAIFFVLFCDSKISFSMRDAGWKLNQSGDLFDLSDAPFVEKLVTVENQSAAAKVARGKLQAVLDELNPAAGKNSTTASPPGRALRQMKKAGRAAKSER